MKKLWLALLLLFFTAVNAEAIAVDTGATTKCYDDFSTSVTCAVTVASNSNRIMVVQQNNPSDGTPNASCTYNGSALTSISGATQSYQFGTDYHEVFYLIAPDIGTNNLVCNYDSANHTVFSVMVIYDAAQQAPEASAKAESSSQSITTVTDGAMIIYMAGDNANTSLGTPTNFTEEYEHNNSPTFSMKSSGGYYVKPTAGSETPSVTGAQVIGLTAWEAASGGGGGSGRRIYYVN